MRMYRIAAVPWLVFAFTAGVAAQAKQPTTSATPAQAAPKAHALSPEELTAEGETVVHRGTSVSQAVRNMLEEARKESDIIKITCLDDKLTQINVNLRTAESRLDALRKAVDPDRRMHEYTVLTVLGQKLQVLDQEAHQCVGQAMYETGATKVVTVIETGTLPFEESPNTLPVILPAGSVAMPPPPVSATN
jgi:hypothetical protein